MKLRRKPAGRRHRDRGQSLAEMALILPVLLALVVGIVELGRAWNVRQVLTNAAREGARVAVVQSTLTDTTVNAAVESRMQSAGLDMSKATIQIQGLDGGVGSVTTVTVTYLYEFLFLGPVVDLLTEDPSGIPGTMTISSVSTMRNE